MAVVAPAARERSDEMLRRSCSDMRAALCTKRCCESGFDASDVRSDLVIGELAERSELLFSVCRNNRWARLGESMIIASTVDVDEIPDKR